MDLTPFSLLILGFLFGTGIGVGLPFGFELVRLAFGQSRTVLITWSRSRDVARPDHE
jgi:hypothetical protein